MSESQGESTSIDLSVDADEALTVFQQLSAAARDADEQIQQLKQHLAQQVTATFGAQGQQPQTYPQASATLARMDPAEVAQAAPEIAQTQAALTARRVEVQTQAMAYAGSTPGLATQSPADVLAQFQQAMAQREQQQQAQRERQAQQAAAGVERPARYGYDQSAPLAPSHASSTPTPLPLAPTIQAMGPTSAAPAAPLATTSDDRLAHALSAPAPTGTSAPGQAPGARDNDAPMGAVLPVESGRSNPAPPAPHLPAMPTGSPPVLLPDAPSRPVVGVPSSAPLATTGDERLAQVLTAQNPPATTATTDAATGTTTDAASAATGPLPGTFDELAAAARTADTQLQGLKQQLLDAFNAIPRGSQPAAASYSDAVTRLQGMNPDVVQELHPDIAQTQGAINARRDELTGQVSHFAADNPEATAEPLPAQQDMLTRWQELLRQHNAQQQQQAASSQGGDDEPLPNPGGAKYYRQSARSGPFVPPGMERLARYGYDASQEMDAHDARQRSGLPGINGGGNSGNGGGNGNDTTQQDRTATVLSDHIVQAFSRSAGGMLAGGISGAANAAGMGATGDVLAGLARPLIGMIGEAAPLALGAIGAIGGVAGVGLGINALQSQYAGESQTLAGSVGTTTGATPSSELDIARQAGWPLMFHEAQSVASAQQLGDAGVQSGQLGGALTASMDLARVGGIGLDQTTALTGQMMQGGMSANQVGDTYAQMDQAARESGISLGRLVDGMKALNQAAGVGQISVNGLAAAQALTDQTGTKINIAQAMAGTIGSTGTNALAQGYMLGLDPAQFDAAQREPAKLWDAYANTARRYDVGSGGSRIAQQALSEAGFDFSGMKGNQAETFIQKLVAEGPNAAQKYEASLQKREAAPGAPGPHTFAELTKASVTVAHNITNASKQFKIGVEEAAAGFVTSLSGVDGRGTGTAYTVTHARTAHRVNADGTISDSTGMPIVNIPPSLQTVQDRLRGNATRFGNDGTTYASDGTPLAGTGGVGTHPGLTGNPYGTGLHYAEQQGMSVKNIAGFAQAASPDVVRALDAASKRTGVPVQVLLAQAAQETSNFNTTAISNDGGYGLAQMTDPKVAQQYLSQAAHELHKPVSSDWHQMAFNPAISAQAMADYDKANFLSKQGAGSWEKSLAMYNGGENGWNITGHPGQGRDYGTGIAQRAEEVQHRLAITVTTQDQSGRHTGRTHVTHSIDTSRKHVAAQSYGPDQRPPSPGLPHLPGHLGGPIRR